MMANGKRWAMLIGLVLFCHSQVFACRGKAPSTPEDGLKGSEVVFLGKVIAADSEHVTFTVDKIWKGSVNTDITLLNLSSCPAFYDVGKKYIVYTNRMFGAEAGLVTSMLHRYVRLDLAVADLAVLGSVSDSDFNSLKISLRKAVILALMILLILACLFFYRRTRVREL